MNEDDFPVPVSVKQFLTALLSTSSEIPILLLVPFLVLYYTELHCITFRKFLEHLYSFQQKAELNDCQVWCNHFQYLWSPEGLKLSECCHTSEGYIFGFWKSSSLYKY